MIDFTTKLPEMKSGNELISALSIIPEYNETICQQNQAARLMALSDLYHLRYGDEQKQTQIRRRGS